MKESFLALLFFALASFPAAAKPLAPDVSLALAEWKAAVESASLDNIMKLYDKRAVMISTFVQNPMTERRQIAAYFKKVIANPGIEVDIEDAHSRVYGDVAVSSGRYTLSYLQDGEPVTLPARFSFTYRLDGGKWLIVDQHSSRVPLPEEAK